VSRSESGNQVASEKKRIKGTADLLKQQPVVCGGGGLFGDSLAICLKSLSLKDKRTPGDTIGLKWTTKQHNRTEQGNTRTDLKEQHAWEDYCEEIKVPYETMNLWLRRFFEPPTELAEVKSPPFPEGKYNVIYADPPWKYNIDSSTGATRSPETNNISKVIYGKQRIRNNNQIIGFTLRRKKKSTMGVF
jgi:hypothetical protein